MNKKLRLKYKKLLDKRLDELGIQDKIQMKASKTLKMANPEYKENPTNPADGAQPKEFTMIREQGVNLRRNLTKKLMSGTEQAMKAFLSSNITEMVDQPSESPTQVGTP